VRIHHVQVAIPRGGEDEARRFYADLIGMEEIPKPTALAARGGCWFRLGAAEIHCGVEAPFSPALKAHPALEVEDLGTIAGRLHRAGVEIRHETMFPGRDRFYCSDPFGNRIEFLGPVADAE
jgi:catechol 2,3-dioxygenase-like lactoylglutathione lyase family enzyme